MQNTRKAEEIKIGRRQLLVSASLAGTIATMPGAGSATTADPHPDWLADWKRVDAATCFGDQDIDYDSPEWMERERLGTKIANTIATTPEGLNAQWEWLEADFGYLTDDMLGGEYADFFRVLKAGMERLI